MASPPDAEDSVAADAPDAPVAPAPRKGKKEPAREEGPFWDLQLPVQVSMARPAILFGPTGSGKKTLARRALTAAGHHVYECGAEEIMYQACASKLLIEMNHPHLVSVALLMTGVDFVHGQACLAYFLQFCAEVRVPMLCTATDSKLSKNRDVLKVCQVVSLPQDSPDHRQMKLHDQIPSAEPVDRAMELLSAVQRAVGGDLGAPVLDRMMDDVTTSGCILFENYPLLMPEIGAMHAITEDISRGCELTSYMHSHQAWDLVEESLWCTVCAPARYMRSDKPLKISSVWSKISTIKHQQNKHLAFQNRFAKCRMDHDYLDCLKRLLRAGGGSQQRLTEGLLRYEDVHFCANLFTKCFTNPELARLKKQMQHTVSPGGQTSAAASRRRPKLACGKS